ncbi:Chromatin modification-related protein YNG2 [Frankliniella fusca]|nr:Chromatin modification-related protein YNG2 [Frankliniella fusca]
MKFKPGYSKTLTGPDLARYKTLIVLCGNIDPYEVDLKSTTCTEDNIPPVNIVHILHYLVNTTKAYTMKQFQSYKATDAHKFATSGWIQQINFLPVGSDKILCLGRVKHSFRIGDTALKPWCLVKKTGDVLCGWCDCVAGCSESCSHVGAILYGLEYGYSVKEKQTCTSKACSWLPPSLKEVPFAPVKDIDFTPSAVKRRRMLGEDDLDPDDPSISTTLNVRPPLDEDSVKSFLSKIHDVFDQAAILRVVPEFADEYAAPSVNLPLALGDLFDSKFCNLSYDELCLEARKVFASGCVNITFDQSKLIERRTRKQSLSTVWKTLRAGLVTASVMYSLLHTDLEDPSISLIKKCCYPFDKGYMSFWMRRGLKLEPQVKKLYYLHLQKSHQNVKAFNCGFMRPLEAPWLGASPDCVVYCSCCGWGLGEIKCPKYPNSRPGYIRPEHFYQIQTQLFCAGISKFKYCDYIVYHPDQKPVLNVNRVEPDTVLQDEIVDKSKDRFLKILLPELMGHYFSSLKQLSNDANQERLICYCQKRERHPMITCVGDNCTFQVFHAQCVGVRFQKANWLCPQCKP